jgi:hypothetical protein
MEVTNDDALYKLLFLVYKDIAKNCKKIPN